MLGLNSGKDSGLEYFPQGKQEEPHRPGNFKLSWSNRYHNILQRVIQCPGEDTLKTLIGLFHLYSPCFYEAHSTRNCYSLPQSFSFICTNLIQFLSLSILHSSNIRGLIVFPSISLVLNGLSELCIDNVTLSGLLHSKQLKVLPVHLSCIPSDLSSSGWNSKVHKNQWGPAASLKRQLAFPSCSWSLIIRNHRRFLQHSRYDLTEDGSKSDAYGIVGYKQRAEIITWYFWAPPCFIGPMYYPGSQYHSPSSAASSIQAAGLIERLLSTFDTSGLFLIKHLPLWHPHEPLCTSCFWLHHIT